VEYPGEKFGHIAGTECCPSNSLGDVKYALQCGWLVLVLVLLMLGTSVTILCREDMPACGSRNGKSSENGG
jgi:hypothetical protein